MPRETELSYEQFLEEVEGLDFIQDRQTADTANKAVIGAFISRLGEENGRALVERLPHPLSFEKLAEYGIDKHDISVRDYISYIAIEFGLDFNESRELIDMVLLNIKECMDSKDLYKIRDGLSDDWVVYLDEVWSMA